VNALGRGAPRRAVVAAALALLAAWPLHRALAGQVLYYRDIHLVWHAHTEAFVRAVLSGALPLWNPHAGFGQPMLGDPDYMAAYPLTWLNLIMPAWLYYTLFAAVHLAWAGLGLFALARRWRAGHVAALAGAGIWMLSGPLLSLVCLWHHYASTCWMPWVFLAAERALLSRRPAAFVLWGVTLAAQILAGSADVVAMTLAALLAYVLAWFKPWRRTRWTRLRAAAPWAAAAVALSVGLSAVQWGAALSVLRQSVRWSLGADTRLYWSVHPLALAQLLVPRVWEGLPLAAGLTRALFEGREPFLRSLYLGAATLPLAASALAAGSRRARVLAALVLIALLVALGRHTPLYPAAVAVLPPLRVLRYPEKAFALVAFAWSLLCALGVQAWTSRLVPARRWVVAVLVPAVLAALGAAAALALVWTRPRALAASLLDADAAADPSGALAPAAGKALVAVVATFTAAALAALYGRLAGQRLAFAAAALAIADLGLVHAGLVDTAPRQLYARPPLVDQLRSAGAARLYVYDYSADTERARLPAGAQDLQELPPGWTAPVAFALAQQMHLQPAIAGRWKLDTGFERDQHALYPYDLAQLVLLLPSVEGTPQHLTLLRMGGVTHVLAYHHVAPALRPVLTAPGLFTHPLRVYEVPDPLPHALAVAGARPADGVAAFAALLDPSFDPRREAVLPAGTAAAAPGVAGRVRLVSRDNHRVRLQAEMDRDGYAVLLDAYDGGWEARVDGQRRPLLKANVAFRAVALPAGSHLVEMEYRPLGARVGLALTVLSLLVLAALCARVRRPALRARRVGA
jgi:hypothetical protein